MFQDRARVRRLIGPGSRHGPANPQSRGASGLADEPARPPGAAELKEQLRLGFLAHDVTRLRQNVLDQALRPLGVTRLQWRVLANLAAPNGRPRMQTEIARGLDVCDVALVGVLDQLEDRSLVVRRPDSADRRAKRVELTAAGAELLAGIEHGAAALHREMMNHISPGEIETFEGILLRMKARLMAMDSALAPDPEHATTHSLVAVPQARR